MVDSLDKQLIARLEKDASQASGLLSEDLKIHPSTVRRRVNRLIEEGVIRIAAIPDPDKTGYHFVAIVAFDIDHENLESVLDSLSRKEQVRWLSSTTGRFDAIALVWFTSSSEYYDFIQTELAKLEGIKNIETFVCLQGKKRSGTLKGE